MGPPIAVLRPEVAERIAAGEVIERPASVVRELLDNALDAAATQVAVELRGGGLELVRVTDDGHGIPADQVELAFARHATSKLREWDDLSHLATLGFRGEALPSIAAVSETTMVTRAADAELGTLLVVRAGEVLRRGRVARQPGTSVTVRHLFQNVPARLKFLPAERHEALLVGQLVRRYALAHPAVRFTLVVDGKLSFQSSGSGRLERALAEVYGDVVAQALLPLRAELSPGSSVGGMISPRALHRPGRQHLTLLINRRWAVSRGLAAALEDAYRPSLPRGRHPIAVVTVTVPPRDLDPNVHPAKTEVKLARERELAEALGQAVREALERTAAEPSPAAVFLAGEAQPRLPIPRRRVAEAPPSWGRADQPTAPLGAALAGARVLAQLHQSLILLEAERGFFLVDQHRAHERVLYEQLVARASGAGAEAQSLLEPLVVEVRPAQAALLEQRAPFLERLGFVCERFGGRQFLVRALPVLRGQEDITAQLLPLLEEAASEQDGWRERLLVSLACRSALRRRRPLGEAEMRLLARELAATAVPAACPHGSTLVLHFTPGFLERQFGW